MTSPIQACNRTGWRTRHAEAHVLKPRAKIRIWECRTATSQLEPEREWSSKRLHSDLTSTHQNTADSRTSIRDFLFPIVS